MSDSKKKKELEIDEEKAYAELCEIIAEAIQTQDANLLETRISEWKRKYPFRQSVRTQIIYTVILIQVFPWLHLIFKLP